MQKQELLEKTQKALQPLETENIIAFLKNVTVKTLLENPLVLAALALVFFYGIIKRSRFMLLFIFTLVSLLMLVRYTLPTGDEGLSVATLLPFVGGCLGIGAVLLYFTFIRTE